MSNLRKAAQQALEALEEIADEVFSPYDNKLGDAILALRAALAQQDEPVQEPVDVALLEYRGNSVAFIHQKMTAYRTGIDAAWDAFEAKGLHPDGKTSLADMIAKYTAPPQRKPQTIDEAMQQPRAMAQAYENGYKAGVANEREACAKVCESRFMGDLTREDMEARRCAAAIRARGNT